MPNPATRKCPKCGKVMDRLDYEIEQSEPQKVWDLGLTGSGTTVTSTTSGDRWFGVSGTSVLSPQDSKPKTIVLVPYECPNCHHKESYRE